MANLHLIKLLSRAPEDSKMSVEQLTNHRDKREKIKKPFSKIIKEGWQTHKHQVEIFMTLVSTIISISIDADTAISTLIKYKAMNMIYNDILSQSLKGN